MRTHLESDRLATAYGHVEHGYIVNANILCCTHRLFWFTCFSLLDEGEHPPNA